MPSRCRVLYVDDDKDSCELVKAMLHFSNPSYELTTAGSPEDAVSLVAKQSFDLFILDYALPGMSGVELCRHIRKKNPTKPIMFLTAMAYPEHRASGLAAGADEYLVKPNDLSRLIETINGLLHEKPSSSGGPPNKSPAYIEMYEWKTR